METKRWTRRVWLAAAGAMACGPETPGSQDATRDPRPRRTVLLRSGWQTENIGDIAHTPGVLRLLSQNVSGVDVILWCNALDRGVDNMLRRHFPAVRIVQGDTGEDGRPLGPELAQAFERADFLLHGSGPSVVARRHVEAWRAVTGKPYGIFGVTISAGGEAASPAMDPGLRDLLNGAAFVFTRETASLDNVRRAGVTARSGFAPDGTFSLKILNEEAAAAVMAKFGLASKKFIAVVPRLRYTPYHKFRASARWNEEQIREREAVNARHAEGDHAKLREAIIRWVRETGHNALLCAEMTYELDLLDPLLYRPLPEDVRRKVFKQPAYWLTDTAASLYRRAAAVISFECHSPIIAAANDTPCVYVRQPEDGIKGQMWRDIGLPRWVLEIETVNGAAVAERLMEIQGNRLAAEVQVHEAVVYARSVQSKAIEALRDVLWSRSTVARIRPRRPRMVT